jgi:Flp pilus assembly protein TadD/4-amino-4-deoxy-L-arabinose transferase-like glycosyltransferase
MTVLALFGAALLVRLLYLWQSADNPTFNSPIVDSRTYHALALGWVERGEFSGQFLWQPVFYPYVLAALYKLCGPSLLAVKIVQLVLGSVTCVLTFRLGRRLFGRRAGLAAGLLVVFNGPLIFFEAEILSVGWAAFWSVVLVTLLLDCAETGGRWTFGTLGFCGALSVLTRPTFLPFLAAGIAWAGWRQWRPGGVRIDPQRSGNLRTAGGRLVLVLAGALSVLAPVSAFNHTRTGHLGILPASGGLNLYVGNNPDFERTVMTRPGYAWQKLTVAAAWDSRNDEAGADSGDVSGVDIRGNSRDAPWREQSAFLARVRHFMLEHPDQYLRGLGQKALHFLGSREIPRNVDVYAFRPWSTLLRLLVWRWGPFGFPFGLILPLALSGLVLAWRRTPAPIKLYVFLYAAAIVLVFVSARYRTAMTPILAVLAGQGAFELWHRFRSGDRRAIGLIAIAGLALSLAITLPGPFAQEKVDGEAELYHGVGYNHYLAHRWSAGAEAFRRAAALNDELMEAHYYLGLCLANDGRFAEAIAELQRASRLDPTFEPARHWLQEIQPRAVDIWLQDARRAAAAGDFAAAVPLYERAVETAPTLPDAHLDLGIALENTGDTVGAAVHYRAAWRLSGGRPYAAGRLAWLLATARSDSLRNGTEAVKLAEQACAETAYRDPWQLGVLAAAYAEIGRFQDAVATVEKAVDIAPSTDQAVLPALLERALSLYRAGRPFRE